MIAKKIICLFSLFFILFILSCTKNTNQTSSDHKNLEMPGELDDYLNQLSAYGFAGTVLVAKKGEILLNKGYGLSDRKSNILCSPDTVYDIGSITKQFTAAAILKLEAEGKLSTDDPITKYFDNVPGDKKDITIHHLLTHTSGLRHGYGGDYEVAHRDKTVQLMFDTPLDFEPGKAWSYSNGGFSILGAIIEKLSGKSYEVFLNDAFFNSIGMHSTGYTLPEWDEKYVVRYQNEGLSIDFESPLDRPGPYWHLYTNGGILSTTGDLFKWHLALKNKPILPVEQKKKYFTPYVKTTRDNMFYAYGWLVRKTNRNTTSIEHGGGSHEGVNCRFLRFVDEDAVIIVLSHVFRDFVGVGSWAVDKIEKIVFGQDKMVLPETIALDSSKLENYAGDYALPGGAILSVSVEKGHLVVTAKGKEAILLLTFPEEKALKEEFKQVKESKCIFQPQSEKDFVSLNFWSSKLRNLSFQFSKTNKVSGLTYQADQGKISAAKIK